MSPTVLRVHFASQLASPPANRPRRVSPPHSFTIPAADATGTCLKSLVYPKVAQTKDASGRNLSFDLFWSWGRLSEAPSSATPCPSLIVINVEAPSSPRQVSAASPTLHTRPRLNSIVKTASSTQFIRSRIEGSKETYSVVGSVKSQIRKASSLAEPPLVFPVLCSRLAKTLTNSSCETISTCASSGYSSSSNDSDNEKQS